MWKLSYCCIHFQKQQKGTYSTLSRVFNWSIQMLGKADIFIIFNQTLKKNDYHFKFSCGQFLTYSELSAIIFIHNLEMWSKDSLSYFRYSDVFTWGLTMLFLWGFSGQVVGSKHYQHNLQTLMDKTILTQPLIHAWCQVSLGNRACVVFRHKLWWIVLYGQEVLKQVASWLERQ